MNRRIVAQVSNLLYRRLPVGRLHENRMAGGLEIRDTADWKSALQPSGSWSRCANPESWRLPTNRPAIRDSSRPLLMNRRWNAAFRRQIATRAQAAGCRLKAAFRFTGTKRENCFRRILTPALSPSEGERVPAGRVEGNSGLSPVSRFGRNKGPSALPPPPVALPAG